MQIIKKAAKFSIAALPLILFAIAGEIKSWQAKEIGRTKGPLENVVFLPDGNTIASGGYMAPVQLWDIKNCQLLSTFKSWKNGNGAFAFTSDGLTLVSANAGYAAGNDADNSLCIWSVKENKLRRTIPQEDSIRSLDISPDNTIVAFASNSTAIQRMDMRSWENIEPYWDKSNLYSANCVTYSHSGQFLAAGVLKVASNQDIVALWDTETNRLSALLSAPGSYVNSVAFSPNDELLVTGSGGNQENVKVWNVATGKVISSFNTGGFFCDVAFSPDGDTVAACSTTARLTDKNVIMLWSIKKNALLRTIENDSTVSSLDFSSDGNSLVSGDVKGTIKLWRIK